VTAPVRCASRGDSRGALRDLGARVTCPKRVRQPFGRVYSQFFFIAFFEPRRRAPTSPSHLTHIRTSRRERDHHRDERRSRRTVAVTARSSPHRAAVLHDNKKKQQIENRFMRIVVAVALHDSVRRHAVSEVCAHLRDVARTLFLNVATTLRRCIRDAFYVLRSVVIARVFTSRRMFECFVTTKPSCTCKQQRYAGAPNVGRAMCRHCG